MEVPKKTKADLPYDPAIPFLCIYPKEFKSTYHREYLDASVHYNTVTIVLEPTWVSNKR